VSLTVASVALRPILDSRGQHTVEAEVTLEDGAAGRGSAPAAIRPGRRERPVTPLGKFALRGDAVGAPLRDTLLGRTFAGLEGFDATLVRVAEESGLGTNFTLPLSLAASRAAAAQARRPLHGYLAELAGTDPAMPHPLVNVFSGGIHSGLVPNGFQQIMLVPENASIGDDVAVALKIFNAVQRRLRTRAERYSLSDSSGLLVDGASSGRLVAELADLTAYHGNTLGVGVDVAAEHLQTAGGRYRLGPRELSGDDLAAEIERLSVDHDLVYVEDPFSPEDAELWAELTAALSGRALVVGDDLFATDSERIEPALASAILLKPSQAGTITRTLAAAAAAREAGLALCVSHRSGETEDTFICDLAVAIGARFVKIGGPRRGDRIAKWNQLLRLGENESLIAVDPFEITAGKEDG
jgi:enolase